MTARLMMGATLRLALGGLALICPGAFAGQAVAQTAPALRNPQVEVSYLQPSAAGLRPIYERLKNRQVLEELTRFLAPLRLPRKMTIELDQCGAPTRTYKSKGPVTVCYELVDQIEKTAAKVDAGKRAAAISGAFIVATLHEVARGVFDILEVPIWGRSEDAADRLAALVMLQFGEGLALRTLTGATLLFNASNKTWNGTAFADVESPDQQRYYNYLCIAYGGAPISFKDLVQPDKNGQQTLPAARAVRCASEYAQVLKAFNQWITPSVDPNLLVTVRATQWLSPGDVK
jgi:hypothetical protein